MKMKKLLFVALACGLSWSACAQEGLEKKQFTRVLPSDINQRVGFFTWLNPDCTAGGNVISLGSIPIVPQAAMSLFAWSKSQNTARSR
jgi:hypothetical protein